MSDLLSYELWHTSDHPECTDADGQSLPAGWYYQFPEAEPVGPFMNEGSAELCAEAELEEFESAIAAEF